RAPEEAARGGAPLPQANLPDASLYRLALPRPDVGGISCSGAGHEWSTRIVASCSARVSRARSWQTLRARSQGAHHRVRSISSRPGRELGADRRRDWYRLRDATSLVRGSGAQRVASDGARRGRGRAQGSHGEHRVGRWPSHRGPDAPRGSIGAASVGMILGTSRAVRVYAYPEAVDLRKGYDGLFGLVKQGLTRDPESPRLLRRPNYMSPATMAGVL